MVQLNMQIELHLCLGPLLGEWLPQGCKHRAPHPLEPVGSGALEGKCSLTRYALSNVCSIKSVEPPISSIGSILWFSSHWSWISQILNLFSKVLIEIDNNGSIYFEIRIINRGFIYFDSNFSYSPFFFPNIKSIKRWHKYFRSFLKFSEFSSFQVSSIEYRYI